MASVDLGHSVKNPTPVEPPISNATGMSGKLKSRDHLRRFHHFCFGRALKSTVVGKVVAPAPGDEGLDKIIDRRPRTSRRGQLTLGCPEAVNEA